MRKIFIDCGANDGCSVRKFKKIIKNHEDYEMYSFEPNSVFHEAILNTGSNLINKAVWIKDEEVDFFIVTIDRYGKSNKSTGASTLNAEKNNWNKRVHQEVQAERVQGIDLSNWIIENFNPEDEIILKMDIEGSEYDVLEKMLQDGSMFYINQLWVEFHKQKCGVSMERHDKLNKELDSLNIYIDREWNAL